MTFGDFNTAFQNQFASPLSAPSAHDIAAEIVRRDQQRTHWLAGFCLLLWIAGAAGMGLLVYGLNEFVMGIRLSDAHKYLTAKAIQDAAIDSHSSGADSSKQSVDKLFNNLGDDGTSFFHHALPYIDGALICLLLAALCTVWLVFASRRTTLNRINISLAQISEQLRQMAKPSDAR
ncbi:MAG TPA: hypothetical protein VFE46_14525 [Pirellulales bacterium]|jgi:hypothetical protein|nr:hypothetical protein [Pirellulales bacterium]